MLAPSITELLQEIAPEDVLRRKTAEAKRKEAEQLEQAQQLYEQQRLDQIERIKRDKEEMEARIKAEQASEMERLEEEYKAMMQAEAQQAKIQLERRRAELDNERQQAEQQRMAEMGDMDAEMKDKILAEFEADRQALEDAMERERERQASSLRQKLRKRHLRQRRRQDAARAAEVKARMQAKKERLKRFSSEQQRAAAVLLRIQSLISARGGPMTRTQAMLVLRQFFGKIFQRRAEQFQNDSMTASQMSDMVAFTKPAEQPKSIATQVDLENASTPQASGSQPADSRSSGDELVMRLQSIEGVLRDYLDQARATRPQPPRIESKPDSEEQPDAHPTSLGDVDPTSLESVIRLFVDQAVYQSTTRKQISPTVQDVDQLSSNEQQRLKFARWLFTRLMQLNGSRHKLQLVAVDSLGQKADGQLLAVIGALGVAEIGLNRDILDDSAKLIQAIVCFTVQHVIELRLNSDLPLDIFRQVNAQASRLAVQYSLRYGSTTSAEATTNSVTTARIKDRLLKYQAATAGLDVADV